MKELFAVRRRKYEERISDVIYFVKSWRQVLVWLYNNIYPVLLTREM